MHESLEPKQINPSRDLVLIAAGVDDYRYVHTLETWIARVEARNKDSASLAAAKKFRADLHAELSLDLSQYYEFRNGSYAENWYPKTDNPWQGVKFERTRREIARHIQTLQKEAIKRP